MSIKPVLGRLRQEVLWCRPGNLAESVSFGSLTDERPCLKIIRWDETG